MHCVFMAALPTRSQNAAVSGTQQFASRATGPSCDWNSRQHACLVTDMTVIGDYSRVPYMYSWVGMDTLGMSYNLPGTLVQLWRTPLGCSISWVTD